MTSMTNARAAVLFSALAAASLLYAQDASAAKVRFQSPQTGKCLVGSATVGARAFTDTCSSTRTDQQWLWTNDADGWVTFKNVKTGQCMRSIARVLTTATCSTSTYQDFFPYVIQNPGGGQPYYTMIYKPTPGDLSNTGCFVNYSGTTVQGYSHETCIFGTQINYTWKTIPL